MANVQSFDFVTEEATEVDQVRTFKDKVHFTYFNESGLWAKKEAANKRIDRAIAEGRCKSGAYLAYGSGRDYSYYQMRKLAGKKRVSGTEWSVFSEMLAREINQANDFADSVEEKSIAKRGD